MVPLEYITSTYGNALYFQAYLHALLFAEYTTVVVAAVANNCFYCYPKKSRSSSCAVLAFLLLSLDCTKVMVGDIILPSVVLCANSSLTGSMKCVNRLCIKRCFPYCKLVCCIQILPSQGLNIAKEVKAYLELQP